VCTKRASGRTGFGKRAREDRKSEREREGDGNNAAVTGQKEAGGVTEWRKVRVWLYIC
jgi:hypothetical protein